MAKKKENLKEMTVAELESKVATMEESLRALRFNTQGAKNKNVKEAGTIKKNIARIKTEISSKNS